MVTQDRPSHVANSLTISVYYDPKPDRSWSPSMFQNARRLLQPNHSHSGGHVSLNTLQVEYRAEPLFKWWPHSQHGVSDAHEKGIELVRTMDCMDKILNDKRLRLRRASSVRPDDFTFTAPRRLREWLSQSAVQVRTTLECEILHNVSPTCGSVVSIE